MVSSIEHNIAVYTVQHSGRVQKHSHKTLSSYLLATLVPEVLSLFATVLLGISFSSPATTWTLEQDTDSPHLEGAAQDLGLWTVLVYVCVSK